MSIHRLVFVLGPTAVGKSHLAIEWAQAHGGAILNCDSVQSFTKVSIGAAKPDAATRKRVPHLLLDWVEPGQEFNASLFRDQALQELAVWLKRGPVFAVGGSGFYVRALCRGTFDVKAVPLSISQHWRKRAEVEGSAVLHALLVEQDPAYGQRISANDAYRITRALSLMQVEGRTMTAIRQEFDKRPSGLPFDYLKLGLRLPKQELMERIRRRYEQMMSEGWRAEVEPLVAEGLSEWQPLKSVGYKEMVAAIEGRLPWEQLEEAVVNSTMRLAKKQMTWFRADPEIHWFHAREEQEIAAAKVREFLLGN